MFYDCPGCGRLLGAFDEYCPECGTMIGLMDDDEYELLCEKIEALESEAK